MAATGVPVRPLSGHAGATVADDLTTPKLGGAVTAPLGEPAYHGLHPGDLKAYPLLSLGSGSMPPTDPALQVRALRAPQFAELYDQYVRLDVPPSVVFPYLHCGAGENSTQNAFFGVPWHGPSCPAYRGLTVVRADAAMTPRGTGGGAAGWVVQPPSDSLLLSTTYPNELLKTTLVHPPGAGMQEVPVLRTEFRQAELAPGVCLRNFRSQSVNYVRISDIVVYSPAGLTQDVLAVALCFRRAQQQFWQERCEQQQGGIQYHVFVLTDPFPELERVCPHLVALDSAGRRRHAVDFGEREQEEIYQLTRASAIGPNVDLGPSRDFVAASAPDAPAAAYEIGIETREDGRAPPPSFLQTVTQSYEQYDAGRADAVRPTAHFECPAGVNEVADEASVERLAQLLLDLSAWLVEQTQPAPGSHRAPRHALIHCADGYTDSSLLALTYLMRTRRLALPDAYLDLQLRAGRSFFVFEKDLRVLRAVEARLGLQAVHSDGDWLSDAHFDGSFPSRILPFLYLGGINHALNARLLHALGITHVVSVGESGLRQPQSAEQGSTSLLAAHRAGQIHVLDLDNVMDDGIDSLRSAMHDAVEYIEAARLAGGRVLVHCRAGVSRSSTTVLAYVMAHLDVNLIEAYLFVRSRRLNILIQPHLLFFWELRGWEATLARLKDAQAEGKPSGLAIRIGAGRTEDMLLHAQPLQSMHTTWGFLCREIAALNERYCI